MITEYHDPTAPWNRDELPEELSEFEQEQERKYKEILKKYDNII